MRQAVRLAMAVRWIRPLVDPPIACSTTCALRKAAGVRSSLGRGPPETAISAARRPLNSAMRMRSACGAGTVALMGRERPKASITQAMVLAVPITMQVPTEGASRLLTRSISASSISPARCALQRRRQSVQAPSTSPLWWPTTMGPTGMTTVGRSTLAAAITCAGRVLSQPPMTRTASMGWARSISSVSIAMRLRRYIEVGCAKLSWIEIVGNTMGRPPASITPRLAASIRAGALPWQGL